MQRPQAAKRTAASRDLCHVRRDKSPFPTAISATARRLALNPGNPTAATALCAAAASVGRLLEGKPIHCAHLEMAPLDLRARIKLSCLLLNVGMREETPFILGGSTVEQCFQLAFP
jgi:hypothetical protein